MVEGMTRQDLEIEMGMLHDDLRYFQERIEETQDEVGRIAVLLNTPARKQRNRSARKPVRKVTRSRVTRNKR